MPICPPGASGLLGCGRRPIALVLAPPPVSLLTRPAPVFLPRFRAGRARFMLGSGVAEIHPDWYQTPGASDNDGLQKSVENCENACVTLLNRARHLTKVRWRLRASRACAARRAPERAAAASALALPGGPRRPQPHPTPLLLTRPDPRAGLGAQAEWRRLLHQGGASASGGVGRGRRAAPRLLRRAHRALARAPLLWIRPQDPGETPPPPPREGPSLPSRGGSERAYRGRPLPSHPPAAQPPTLPYPRRPAAPNPSPHHP